MKKKQIISLNPMEIMFSTIPRKKNRRNNNLNTNRYPTHSNHTWLEIRNGKREITWKLKYKEQKKNRKIRIRKTKIFCLYLFRTLIIYTHTDTDTCLNSSIRNQIAVIHISLCVCVSVYVCMFDVWLSIFRCDTN